MKLILVVSTYTDSGGSYTNFYSFEEESKKKAEDDLFELVEKAHNQLKEYYKKYREEMENQPPLHLLQKNKELAEKTFKKRMEFLETVKCPDSFINYKGHSIQVYDFYEDGQFSNPEILTPEEFYQQNLP